VTPAGQRPGPADVFSQYTRDSGATGLVGARTRFDGLKCRIGVRTGETGLACFTDP